MGEIPEPAKFKERREKDALNRPWQRHIPDRCPEWRASMERKVNLFHIRN